MRLEFKVFPRNVCVCVIRKVTYIEIKVVYLSV